MHANRQFLADTIASGLDLGQLTTDDVLRHVTAEVLAHHLPTPLKTQLLAAALKADSMTSTLVVQTIGVQALAEHVPVPILWACVAEAARRSLEKAAPKIAPKLAPAVVSGGKSESAQRPAAAKVPAVVPASASAASVSPAVAAAAPVSAAVPGPEPTVLSSAAGARKPNRSARPARARTGAVPFTQSPAPDVEEDDSMFDVDTRVGADSPVSEFDVIDETDVYSDVSAIKSLRDEETSPGERKR